MKNKIILDKIDKTEEVKPLFKIETNDDSYIVYTKGEKNDCDDIICYASLYKIRDGIQYLEAINERELEIIDGILINIQQNMNKIESSEINE